MIGNRIVAFLATYVWMEYRPMAPLAPTLVYPEPMIVLPQRRDQAPVLQRLHHAITDELVLAALSGTRTDTERRRGRGFVDP